MRAMIYITKFAYFFPLTWYLKTITHLSKGHFYRNGDKLPFSFAARPIICHQSVNRTPS